MTAFDAKDAAEQTHLIEHDYQCTEPLGGRCSCGYAKRLDQLAGAMQDAYNAGVHDGERSDD